MPRVNIYIRNEDWDAWEAIADKPEFIHGALTVLSSPGHARLYAEIAERMIDQQPPPPKPDLTQAKISGVCKNGHLLGPNGKCMAKGCKFSVYA